MKRIIQKMKQSMLMICIAASSHTGIAQCLQKAVTFAGKEPTIDLEPFLKGPSEVDKQNKYFIEFVRTTDVFRIEISPEIVMMSTMVDLYNKVAALNLQNAISGVRITFGMSNKKMVYYYQPVYLIRNSGSSYFKVNDVSPELYYVNNGSDKFAVANLTDVKSDTLFYMKNVEIDQYRNNGFEPFRYETDSWRGDTKSLIFSFQKLFEIYHQAYPSQNDMNDYCKTIAIHNGAANYKRNFTNRWRVKHTLYVDIPKAAGIKSLVAITSNKKAANLGHLCPPSCEDINYLIINNQ